MLAVWTTGDRIAFWGIIVVAIGVVVQLFIYFRSNRKDRKQVLISQGSLDKYIGESKYVTELCRRISGIRNAHINDNGLPSLLYPFVISQLNYLGLQTISDIDKILKKSVDTIARFDKALNKENVDISKAECIKVLCDFLMAKSRSLDQIVAYYDANSLNTEDGRQSYAEKIKHAYNKTVN